jgi:hypothetical protein
MALPVGSIVRQDDGEYLSYAILDEARRWKPCCFYGVADHVAPLKVDPWTGPRSGYVYTTRNAKTGYFKDSIKTTGYFLPLARPVEEEEQENVDIYEDADVLVPGTAEWIPWDDLSNRVHLKLLYRGATQHILLLPHQGKELVAFAKLRFNISKDDFQILSPAGHAVDLLHLPHRDTLVVHDAPKGKIRRGKDVFYHNNEARVFTLADLKRKRYDSDSDEYDDDDDDDQAKKTLMRRPLRYLNQALDDGKILPFFYRDDDTGLIRVGCNFAVASKEEAATFFQDVFSPRICQKLTEKKRKSVCKRR